jgi:DNA-3-methyladenine glycosylase
MRARRGVEDVKKLASGPARFAQAFGIDIQLNSIPIGREVKIRERNYTPQISTSPRIGISRATELEWRFFETGNPFVSRFKSS